MPDGATWNRVLSLAEEVGSIKVKPGEGPSSGAAMREVLSALLELEELFPKGIDPVDDLEGYCVRRLVRAIRRALDQVCAERGCGTSPSGPGPTAASQVR